MKKRQKINWSRLPIWEEYRVTASDFIFRAMRSFEENTIKEKCIEYNSTKNPVILSEIRILWKYHLLLQQLSSIIDWLSVSKTIEINKWDDWMISYYIVKDQWDITRDPSLPWGNSKNYYENKIYIDQ